ncbi:hypothetical protein [Psychromonas antarctica]|uniref:hypothetical protein n=1 Tax=Psychromonas antarctica TaxID=67573 RepID=UPI001EE8EA64|nr:hypothetical protein [Psychromonas antarctica]MCG6201045.1 hypothetical protein [Psychromonas antarctica]
MFGFRTIRPSIFSQESHHLLPCLFLLFEVDWVKSNDSVVTEGEIPTQDYAVIFFWSCLKSLNATKMAEFLTCMGIKGITPIDKPLLSRHHPTGILPLFTPQRGDGGILLLT